MVPKVVNQPMVTHDYLGRIIKYRGPVASIFDV